MNQFPTPDQIRKDKTAKKDIALKYARSLLIAAAHRARGKPFVFAQSLFAGSVNETKLLAEVRTSGWTSALVPDHSDGNYYLISPSS
jgi:hypothetical protein